MPFDALSPDTPSLRTLADVLRDRSRWPADMPEWDYTNPRSCAMRIVWLLWPQQRRGVANVDDLFGLSEPDATRIFVRANERYWFLRWENVQPHHVADAIDAYLARVPEPALESRQQGPLRS